jgi:hypothetical protein
MSTVGGGGGGIQCQCALVVCIGPVKLNILSMQSPRGTKMVTETLGFWLADNVPLDGLKITPGKPVLADQAAVP